MNETVTKNSQENSSAHDYRGSADEARDASGPNSIIGGVVATVVTLIVICLVGLLEIQGRAVMGGVRLSLANEPMTVVDPHSPWLQVIAVATLVIGASYAVSKVANRYALSAALVIAALVCVWALASAPHPLAVLLPVGEGRAPTSSGNLFVDWIRAGALSSATYIYLGLLVTQAVSRWKNAHRYS
ncbi:MAG: hypothetical protein Q4P33_04150 [Flaviflexus sp.]|nr:hypothetical protein [Flaviflexus sp.]